METVELTFQYTQGEYVKAKRQHIIASKTITKTNVVVLAVYLSFSLWYFFSSFSVLSGFSLGFALFALIAGCTLYFYVPIQQFKRTSKYHEEYNLTYTKDGILFKTPTIHSELKWDIYSEFWESTDFYFLIQVSHIYTLIPKRAFLNLADQQAFEKMALSNLKCTKRIL
ncbi:YcxB family protein [Anaerocolumna sp.]|uniref:YcxB family protein n=1 Tax=Anaerocolumna sp. TaxID=2041569 RepID=UPI0028B01E0D|nr:YcxB family protein [Anaerocolumna sp.]